ncbi:MAG: hypothetical protein FWG90_10660 [Oscillospiraceae bacterium]|nr:hypothetical protein [Oscillospiraceae bacterium]
MKAENIALASLGLVSWATLMIATIVIYDSIKKKGKIRLKSLIKNCAKRDLKYRN